MTSLSESPYLIVHYNLIDFNLEKGLLSQVGFDSCNVGHRFMQVSFLYIFLF